ncbi:MAG: hypothetical protein CXZ00_16310 [Acidobacteria bacterium]|nr:MAG: hypothetical protein CXZ00_16310 [Acidobacteriota bacterium]
MSRAQERCSSFDLSFFALHEPIMTAFWEGKNTPFALVMVQDLGAKTTALGSENPRSKRAPFVRFGWF